LGGLPFRDEHDVLPQLERMVEHYEMLQRLIAIPSLEEVTGNYEALLREIAGMP
jgi:hypothetical protein